MQFVWIFAGALIGLYLAAGSEELLGIGAGAALGYLFARVNALQSTVRRLTAETDYGRDAAPPAEIPPPPPVETAAPPGASEPPAPQPARASSPWPAAAKVEPEFAAAAGDAVPRIAAEPRPPGTLDKLARMAKEWLTTGNVPVKLGIIVSFFGVAFLLRYAVDQGIIVISIEARYLAVTVLAAVLLGIGWRLRERLPVYALSMQGGGIGILYLTIFAAFRLHGLVPPAFSFTLLVLLTAGICVLAVLQNSMVLAVLGTVGGFLAPVLVSTGSGNHVALFSYYLLLNAAVLAIAWYRPWRFLNVLGFAFTFGVGTAWGYEYYRPALFASTEPFLVAFFLFYQAIAILFALRQAPKLRGIVDGTLVFGTPVVAFALQAELVADTEYGLAFSAVAVAVFYTLVATWLHRRGNAALRMLIESFIALSVAFATIAIPLALDDRWTAAAWSLEGAALVWVGVRQGRLLAKLSGTLLLYAAGVGFAEHGWTRGLQTPLLNGNFLGGMLISLASLFSARYLAADANAHRFQAVLSAPLLLWGLAWWGGTGAREITDRLKTDLEIHVLTGFIALSVAALALLGRRYDWTAARRTTLGYLPLLPVLAVLYLFQFDHFLDGVGTLSWLLAGAAHFGLLYAYDNGRGKIEGLWHFAGWLLLAAIVAGEAYWRLDRTVASDIWAASAALLVVTLAAVAIVLCRPRLSWPLQRYWPAYLAAACSLVVFQLVALGSIGIDDPGDPRPLPYVPVLNPLDILTVIGLAIALYLMLVVKNTSGWFRQDGFRLATIAWSAAAFVLTTIAVVRGVHHLGGVPWSNRALTGSVSVQSALSIYWAILGFGGMIWGARNRHRSIWMVGTSLMALVVIKLFMVDLGNTGTVARIVSFLGVGGLLLVVGYYAPAPPRAAAVTEN